MTDLQKGGPWFNVVVLSGSRCRSEGGRGWRVEEVGRWKRSEGGKGRRVEKVGGWKRLEGGRGWRAEEVGGRKRLKGGRGRRVEEVGGWKRSMFARKGRIIVVAPLRSNSSCANSFACLEARRLFPCRQLARMSASS